MVPTTGKGKGKATMSSELPSPVEEAASPPSLEALVAYLTLVEEPLLKDLEEEVIFGLVSVYGKAVTKKVQDLLRDSPPFQMAAPVTFCFYFPCSFMSLVVFCS